MPHIQIEVTVAPADEEIHDFTEWAVARYAEVMKTGTGHIAITIRPYEQATLSLGRADPAEPVAVMNVDVRAGRSFEQRRTFATDVMDELSDRWDVPTENIYCVYTEHKGRDFMLYERVLSDWSSDEEADGVQP